jgi:hypothetical protein
MKISYFIALVLLQSVAYGSGSSGGSGGSGGAAGGSHPKLESGTLNKLQQAQEKKILEIREKNKSLNQKTFDQAHTDLTEILSSSVKLIRGGQASEVDYKALDQRKLSSYLKSLSMMTRAEYTQMTRDQKLAFLINTYNAYTIDLIVKNPNIKSIKDLGSFISSPWKKKFIPLFGNQLSLDEVEHSLIRQDPLFQEPRIHFAVNCASIGCPALLNEAFTGDQLERQLQLVTDNFLKDRTRNRIEGNKVVISKIFDWYAVDFEKGWLGITSVQDFLAKNSNSLADDSNQKSLLESKNYKLKYSDYDWNLNKTQ